MLGISKNTVENLIILLAGVLLFQGLSLAPVIGNYIRTQPLWVIGGAVLILALSKRIADNVKFLDRQLILSFLYLVSGILLFHGFAALPQAVQLFAGYPWIVVGAALMMLAFKDKISDSLGG